MRKEARQNTVLLHTFGCQMNKLDAELVKSLLFEGGFSFTEKSEEAGVVLFLTCSVREHAEERVHSRLGALKAWKKEVPDSILGVLGCMAQKDGQELVRRHPHVDLVVGTRDFPRIVELLEKVRAGDRGLVALDRKDRPEVRRNEALRPHPFKAFLSIMRGCDNYCSYCIVPYVRGRQESRPMDNILEEAERLLDSGVKEITLLGQTVNRYDDGKGNRLPELLRRLDVMDPLRRIGFVTSFCANVDRPLIEAIAECKKVSRFLHLPAQSGSDRILEKMKRRYTAGFYRSVVSDLREAVPDMEMGSDFIVGFSGETREDFDRTQRLMEDIRFQQSFIFKYSPRPGTRAVEKMIDDVPMEVKKERNAILLALQERISREKNAQWIGRTVEVLVEGQSPRDPARYRGRTVYNQIAAFPASPDLVGRFVHVPVEEVTALTLLCGDVLEVVA